jgi:hypothetical protein
MVVEGHKRGQGKECLDKSKEEMEKELSEI